MALGVIKQSRDNARVPPAPSSWGALATQGPQNAAGSGGQQSSRMPPGGGAIRGGVPQLSVTPVALETPFPIQSSSRKGLWSREVESGSKAPPLPRPGAGPHQFMMQFLLRVMK